MSMKIVSPESDVISFLFELKEALNNTRFNVETDLDILLCKSNESPMDPNTTFVYLSILPDIRYPQKDPISKLRR